MAMSAVRDTRAARLQMSRQSIAMLPRRIFRNCSSGSTRRSGTDQQAHAVIRVDLIGRRDAPMDQQLIDQPKQHERKTSPCSCVSSTHGGRSIARFADGGIRHPPSSETHAVLNPKRPAAYAKYFGSIVNAK